MRHPVVLRRKKAVDDENMLEAFDVNRVRSSWKYLTDTMATDWS